MSEMYSPMGDAKYSCVLFHGAVTVFALHTTYYTHQVPGTLQIVAPLLLLVNRSPATLSPSTAGQTIQYSQPHGIENNL